MTSAVLKSLTACPHAGASVHVLVAAKGTDKPFSVASLASLGLPGLGDFVGEFLVLIGTFRASPALAAVAAVGVLAATFYALKIVQNAFHGPNLHRWRIADLSLREMIVVAVLGIGLLWLGLYPRPVFVAFSATMEAFEGLPADQALRAPGGGR